ncbi:ATP-binding protein [Lysobacter auxotrophicus]|uniref:histidine kinase n=1 Tax=Lysobacter auxotrophicus TaxID=2992573 RepID=A0ABN6UMU3_9GAMM|nr:ATP-binding protein [Lysobacter auxotrophicus]BDU17705.1 ATP-binding protein [Lysobacter auxotrophicus]
MAVTSHSLERRDDPARSGDLRIQLALDAAGMGSFIWYPMEDRGEPDARLLALFGLPPNTTMSMVEALSSLLHPDDRERYGAAAERAIDPSGDGMLREDIRILRPDGEVRWVAISGQTSFEGVPLRPVRMDGIAMDITERKQAEAVLRAGARTQRFLVALGDALRPLADAGAIMRTAMELLADHLDTNRGYYGEVEHNGVYCRVRDSFNRGVQSLDGRYRLDDYSPSKMDMLRAAHDFVMTDAGTDDGITPAERDRYLALSIRSLINVPLVKNHRFIAVLGVSDERAREWSGEEIEVVRETAERTWAAVERARAEAALRQSEERFQLVARNLDAAFYVVDTSQDRVHYLNEAHRRLWSIEPGRRRETWFQRVHPDDAQRVRALHEAFTRGKAASFDAQYRIVLDDGSVRWIHDRATVGARGEDGRVRTITGLAQDITQQKVAAGLLRQSEEKYRHLFDSIDQGFALIEMIFENGRAVDYRFVEVNPAFERQTGLVDPIGRTARQVAPALDQAWFDIYGEVARTGQPLRFQRRADALDRDFDVYAFRVGSEDAPKVAVLFGDITDRRRMEDALRQADRRKDEFLATLAHELRNPLAPLRTGLELLRRWNEREDAGATLGMMERQVRHLVRMVDDLLDISRISRGKVELDRRHVDLVHEVRVAAEAMQATYEAANRSLSIDLTPTPLMACADATRVTQVLGNLLSNALKFTPEGGHVRVCLAREGDEAVLCVRDDGIGIAHDHLEQIFASFMQVDTSLERGQSGLGLGLAVAKELVLMHGGRIQARSAGLGQGSEFMVRLPLDDDAQTFECDVLDVSGAPFDIERTSAEHAWKRVLVVDDNRASADTLALLLRLSGFDVAVAYEGRQAVERAKAWQPEAVVMDIGMPDLNGFEACRAMRSDAAGRPFVAIALTGWGGKEAKAASRDAGFDLHLVKPAEPSAITELLQMRLSALARQAS